MANNIISEKDPLLAPQDATTVEAQEPSLGELQQAVFAAQRRYMKAWSRTTSGKWHRRFIYGITALLVLFATLMMVLVVQDGLSDDDYSSYSTRVPLEAHIMSKCPDARDCLHDLILPAMQQVSHEVDFKLSYIGNITDHDDGVACKHGQEECLGNIIELCAAKLYPSPMIYLGFTYCLSKQYEDIPTRSLIEDCALEHGISMQRLNDCTSTEDGSLSVDMLRASFNESAAANVSRSCTIRLEGEVRCVRDDGNWTDCEGGSTATDLVRDIRVAHKKRWERIMG